MSQFILINRIKVQNANGVAGFTWGFPAITHFLGFTHSLARKLTNSDFDRLKLSGCAVIAHEHHVHTYGKYGDNFTQHRNPPYLHSHDKASAPPVIEEAKMNMTVSLLMGCEGNIGNQTNDFIAWLDNACRLQRLAGGTILDIEQIQISTTETNADRYAIKRKLLPGFLLMDRSSSLATHYEDLKIHDANAEMLDAWLDFSALKQQARPKSDLIDKLLNKVMKDQGEDAAILWQDWAEHLAHIPYDQTRIPVFLTDYFARLEYNRSNKALLAQWQQYLKPTEKTAADWEFLPKPEAKGFLVPIVVGYKAITPLYENHQIANTRDSDTPVCFVEAVHSVGEWRGIQRLRSASDFDACLWRYEYEENWYLCRQAGDGEMISDEKDEEIISSLNNLFGE